MTKKFPPTPEELNLTQEQMIREMYLDRRKSEWPQDVDAYMITTEELEDITGLCRKTFERMRERGELECVKLGHKVSIVLPFFRPAECGFKSRISRQCEPDSSLG